MLRAIFLFYLSVCVFTHADEAAPLPHSPIVKGLLGKRKATVKALIGEPTDSGLFQKKVQYDHFGNTGVSVFYDRTLRVYWIMLSKPSQELKQYPTIFDPNINSTLEEFNERLGMPTAIKKETESVYIECHSDGLVISGEFTDMNIKSINVPRFNFLRG